MIQLCKYFFEEITEKTYFNVIPLILIVNRHFTKLLLKKLMIISSLLFRFTEKSDKILCMVLPLLL